MRVYNPLDLPVEQLPIIYGFNNGGSCRWYTGHILAEDGESLGGHVCSHEAYMPGDLGMLDSDSPRHLAFATKYPDGYRCIFIPMVDVSAHEGLNGAYLRNQARRPA